MVHGEINRRLMGCFHHFTETNIHGWQGRVGNLVGMLFLIVINNDFQCNYNIFLIASLPLYKYFLRIQFPNNITDVPKQRNPRIYHSYQSIASRESWPAYSPKLAPRRLGFKKKLGEQSCLPHYYTTLSVPFSSLPHHPSNPLNPRCNTIP